MPSAIVSGIMKQHTRCDMHIHSALSVDGQYPPAEILEMVIEAGLKGAVITDHNEIDFSNEFSRIAKDKLLTLNGVELSTRGPGHENIHLLLYGIDSTKRLNKDLNYIRTQYEELTRLRIKKLNEMGIFVTWEDVENTTKKVPSMGPTLGEAVLNEKKNLSNPLLREIYEDGDPEDMGDGDELARVPERDARRHRHHVDGEARQEYQSGCQTLDRPVGHSLYLSSRAVFVFILRNPRLYPSKSSRRSDASGTGSRRSG